MKSLRNTAFLALRQLNSLLKYVNCIFPCSPKVLSFDEWTRADYHARYNELWSSYRRFFSRHGYTLWRRVGDESPEQLPPNDNPRTPDGFSYQTAYTAAHEHCWNAVNTRLHAARTRDNRDVIICLLGDDVSGRHAIEVLQLVGSGQVAAIDKNHTLPVIDWLHQGDLVFGVFPMVGPFSHTPWFETVGDIVEFMSQVIEGVAFLHDYRVAHRDLFITNFLSSRRSGRSNPRDTEALLRPRYYIIDFEWCVRFPTDADPDTCTVTGPPIDFEEYERPAPPEMRRRDPYCPFKADVWQLGCGFLEVFGHVEDIPEIMKLLREMRAGNPTDRPTAHEAVDRLNCLQLNIPSSIMHLPVQRPPAGPRGEDEDYDYYNV